MNTAVTSPGSPGDRGDNATLDKYPELSYNTDMMNKEREMSKMDAYISLRFYEKCLIVWTVGMMALILVDYIVGGL